MKRNLANTAKTWAPVIAWMAVIFVFSTDWFAAPNTSSFFAPLLTWLLPGLPPETIQTLHGALRKLGHWAEYFILANFMGTASSAQWPAQSPASRCARTVLVATLYAISDEWHQSFVPSRSASVVDVSIDTYGAICGAIWTRYRDKPRQPAKKT